MAELDPDAPIPQPTASDPEDVSWALSTAEAMWARGDVAEAVKWLRRGAEAASEAEADERALELAKAAANLATRVPRRSTPAMAQVPSAAAMLEATPQGGPTAPTAPKKFGSSLPPQAGTTPPRGVSASRPAPAQRPSSPAGPQRPLPPRAPASGAPAAPSSPPLSSPPVPSPRVPSVVPVPTSALESGRFAAHIVSDEAAGHRSEGRVRLATQPDDSEVDLPRDRELRSPGFDDKTLDRLEAQIAAQVDDPPADASDDPWDEPPPSSDPRPGISENTAQMPALTELNAIEVLRGRRPLKALASAASDWDAVPTKTLSGAELPEIFPVAPREPPSAEPPPSSASSSSPSSPPASVRPEERKAPLQPSQALRVVLWKDANGVHVAPHGTRVSAITVDVMVVALDPSADIRAWLDPSHRKNST